MLTFLPADLAWRNQAACADADPDLFDGPVTTDQARHVITAWCCGCAVADACHAWAASEPHFDGIAGGRAWRREKPR